MRIFRGSLAKLRLSACALAAQCFYWPESADAHLRWFVSSTTGFDDASYSLDGFTVLIVVGAVAFGAAIYGLHTWSSGRDLRLVQIVSRIPERFEWRVLAVLCGIALLDNIRCGVFLAPNLVLPGPSLVTIGAIAQGALAVLLIFQISFVLSGVLVVVAMAVAGLYFPVLLSLDYVFEFLFLAAALILVGPHLSKFDRRTFAFLGWDARKSAELALPIIRIGVGVTLIVLALHNKLVSPALALAFLSEYSYNFMPMLGITSFTDLHFAFGAGIGELTLGLLLVAGYATRVVTLLLAGFFVTTIFLLGVSELTGHLPIFGIVAVLLTRGSGSLRRALPRRPEMVVLARSQT